MTEPLTFTPPPLLDVPFDHELTQLAMGLRKIVKREFTTAESLRELRSLGWYVHLAEGAYGVDTESADVQHDGGGFHTAFFGDRAAVERAVTLEDVERRGRSDERCDAMAWLGALLGYPACCTAAYVTQAEQGEEASFARLFATGPLIDAPRWNNLFVLSHALISHFPCSLDCEASAELAGATWSHLATEDEARATAVAELLAAPITVWDRYRFIVEHPTHGRLLPHHLDGSAHLLAHPPLQRFVAAIDQPPAGGVRLHFR